MIDIHTHILPYCDDGAETLEDALLELAELNESGVTEAILTPHYIRNVFENNRKSCNDTFNLLKLKLTEQNLNIKIHQGNEIYLDNNIWEDIKQNNLQLADTDYILIETGFSGFPDNLSYILTQLTRKGYKPILAHPERYDEIVNNNDIAEDLISRNVYLQMNVGSFLGYYGIQVQRTALQLLKRKLVHFLGSDTHCNREYYFFSEALKTIAHHTDDDFIKLITIINPRKLLNNQPIEYINN